jgi:hypothetical protein
VLEKATNRENNNNTTNVNNNNSSHNNNNEGSNSGKTKNLSHIWQLLLKICFLLLAKIESLLDDSLYNPLIVRLAGSMKL